MPPKTWARLIDGAVAELATFPAFLVPDAPDAEPIALVPGQTLPDLWSDDVTAVPGIQVGWLKRGDGTFAAPPWDGASAKLLHGTAIEAACAAAITGGFSSTALGAPHWYGSQLTDQANLDADMMAAASGGSATTADIACSADAGATWAIETHSAAQIGQLWADFRAWRIACQVKKRALQAQIAAASDATAASAIVW